jgi:hypothetical protein
MASVLGTGRILTRGNIKQDYWQTKGTREQGSKVTRDGNRGTREKGNKGRRRMRGQRGVGNGEGSRDGAEGEEYKPIRLKFIFYVLRFVGGSCGSTNQ